MSVAAVIIEGTAVKQETVSQSENERKKETHTVEQEVDLSTRIELKKGHPNVDFWRHPDNTQEYLRNEFNQTDTLYHSVEVESVELALYDVEEQAKVFASERPDMSYEESKNKMLRWSNMDDMRY